MNINDKDILRPHAIMILFYCLAVPGLFIETSIAGDIRSERVQFAKGETGATIEARIQGRETADYLLGARAGQSMNVSLETDNAANYFNILAPGETEVALFIGSTGGNRFEGKLPSNGDYTIRVYLMRSAARRNETANYRLDLSITDAAAENPESMKTEETGQDAVVEGTEYHATGEIPCSMGGGQPTGSCPFGVQREGAGSGLVTITKPDGRKRVIFFDAGNAIGADTSEADPGEFSAEKQTDLHIIRIGTEHYEIPDAVISGG